ncbi:MAG: hypothetical protein ACKVOK_06070 [Flavobacteriales bacterium]
MAKGLCNKLKVLVAIMFVATSTFGAFSDSTISVLSQLNAALSSSYTANANWQGQDFQHYAFAGSLNARHQKMGGQWNHQHMILCDLSYLKFIDSLWIKNTDRLQVNLLWSEEGTRFRHSYTLNFSTQLLPSFQYSYDYERRINIKERTAWGFCPATLEAGYGMTRQFWETSNINLAFATVRMSALPRTAAFESVRDEQLVRGNRAYFKMEYGLMLAANIQKKLNDRVVWMNTSRLFCNAFNRDQITIDVQNRITIQLWKFLQLRFETRVAYNPLVNYHFQFSQEVMLGAGFEFVK